MEEEERAAQSAKLQELIRRGTPSDLQEANHLMKIMAGYDQSTKTDYRQKAAEDIGKLQEKQKLLDEMLMNVKPGETIGQQDMFEVIACFLLVMFLYLLGMHIIGIGQRTKKCPTKVAQDGRGGERRYGSCDKTIHFK